MPYINQNDRARIEKNLDFVATINDLQNAGELNYILTRTIVTYFLTNGGRYQQINDVLGALEGAKGEFLRRIVNPYEDSKIKENDDLDEFQRGG